MLALAICSVFLIVGCNHDTEETSIQGLISNTEEAVTEQADDAQTNLEAEVEEVEPEIEITVEPISEAEPEVEEVEEAEPEPEAEPEADTEDSEEETEEDGGVISNILEQVESAINKPDTN